MEGWVKLHRKIIENPLWTSEPFTKGQAWVDLLAMANHKDDKIFINGQWLEIGRGQLHTSELKLAARWKWSKNKVTRFLDALKMDGMLLKNSATGGATNGTTLTLVNYGFYQGGETTDEPTDEPTNGQRTNQRTDNGRNINKNDKNVKNVEEDIYNPPTPLKGGESEKPKAEKFNLESVIENEPEEIRELLQRWLDYKKRQHKFTFKSADSFKTFIKKLNQLSGGDFETAAAIIEQSIANGWSGIFELKNNSNHWNNGRNDFNNPASPDYVSSDRIVAAGRAMAAAGM